MDRIDSPPSSKSEKPQPPKLEHLEPSSGAASLKLAHVVQQYLEQSSDIECTDDNGATLIGQAACSDQTASVRFLVDKGADIAKRNVAGAMLLHWALANIRPSYYERITISGRTARVSCAGDLINIKDSNPIPLFGPITKLVY